MRKLILIHTGFNEWEVVVMSEDKDDGKTVFSGNEQECIQYINENQI